MKILAKYVHGSSDSTDVDTYYVVDEELSFQDAKSFCDSYKYENANVLTIKDGIVSSCYKGTIDECNNSLYVTYPLHHQNYPLMIERMVSRDLGLKYIRAVRIILSHLSRTFERTRVKEALRSQSFLDKVKCLNSIDFSTIDFSGQIGHMTSEDTLKVIAFQFGQALGLAHDKELYTKRSIANQYPNLYPFLYREKNYDIEALNNVKNELCTYLSVIVNEEKDGIVTFANGNQYDVIHEKRV